jgi:hypothetical protein
MHSVTFSKPGVTGHRQNTPARTRGCAGPIPLRPLGLATPLPSPPAVTPSGPAYHCRRSCAAHRTRAVLLLPRPPHGWRELVVPGYTAALNHFLLQALRARPPRATAQLLLPSSPRHTRSLCLREGRGLPTPGPRLPLPPTPGHLLVPHEQLAVPPDLVRCHLLDGLRRPPRAAPAAPLRIRPQPPHCSSSRTARNLPAHRPGRGLSSPSGDTTMRCTPPPRAPLQRRQSRTRTRTPARRRPARHRPAQLLLLLLLPDPRSPPPCCAAPAHARAVCALGPRRPCAAVALLLLARRHAVPAAPPAHAHLCAAAGRSGEEAPGRCRRRSGEEALGRRPTRSNRGREAGGRPPDRGAGQEQERERDAREKKNRGEGEIGLPKDLCANLENCRDLLVK